MIASVCVSRKSFRVERRRVKLVRLIAAASFACVCAAVAHSASAAAPESAAQRIPFKQSDDATGGLLLRVAGSLVVVVLTGVGAVYLLKRYLPAFYHPTFAGSSRINVIEIRRLTPKTTLFLIELEGVHLLLGQNGDRVTTLYERAVASADAAKK